MKHKLLTYSLALLTAAAALFGTLASAHAQAKKPNIVYIVADDLGWKDVGFHGSDIKTPNIDKLAETGPRLEQFYAQPMCTPTRAVLMAGRYPFRYGLQTAVIPSGHTYGLPTDEWLLPQALKEAGCKTAIIGKWHLGHGDPKYWPRQRGFDYQYGPLIGELDYFTHEQHGVVDWYRNNKRIKENGYTTTLLGNEAVRLVTEHDPATPLYLYLTFNAPHTPYQTTQEYLDQYQNIADPSRSAYAGSDDVPGKFSIGPAIVALVQPAKWTLGVLVNNLSSVAGSSDRLVNSMTLHYFINYNLKKGYFLTWQPIVTANWNASSGNIWTVPVGGGIGRIMRLGNQPVNVGLQTRSSSSTLPGRIQT